MTQILIDIISAFIQWGVVPVILLALLGFAVRIVTAVKDPDRKTSARAGLWAGLVLAVVYVVSRLGRMRVHVGQTELPELQTGSLFLGTIVGFGFLWLVRAVAPTRLVGLLTLLLVASSSVALFDYIFISTAHGTVLYGSLGVALGIMLHQVIFPDSMRSILD